MAKRTLAAAFRDAESVVEPTNGTANNRAATQRWRFNSPTENYMYGPPVDRGDELTAGKLDVWEIGWLFQDIIEARLVESFAISMRRPELADQIRYYVDELHICSLRDGKLH